MKEALQRAAAQAAALTRRAGAKTAAGARRAWAGIRRHPVLSVAAVPTLAALYVAALIPFTPSIGDVRKAKAEQPTVVLSADGKELATFKRANRDWVKLADISPAAVAALIATEDHRFYKHPGIDPKRTLTAVVHTLTGDRQGGSTLTQQLARNLYPEEIGRAPTLTRKVKEAITALKIEAVYTKDEILETYLNTVPFLYNAYGIEMAARTYFDKPAKDLDELQAATLVGMLKGTSYYNPVLNPERAVQRRNTVLAQMVKHDRLAQARYDQLKDKPLRLDFERQPEQMGPAPHLAQHLKRWLIDWADRNDYDVYGDGLVVRTTIDSRLQAMANEAVQRQGEALQAVADVEWSRSSGTGLATDPAAYAAQRGKVAPFSYFWSTRQELVKSWVRDTAAYKAAREEGLDEAGALKKVMDDDALMKDLREERTRLQAGFMALDPTNGAVRAWVGSRGWQDDKFDHVQQARRQPGSTFKPFVYGAAFEQGMRPGDMLMDQAVEIRIDRNKVWRPGDVDGTTNAPMTLREGLVRSKNTITAQVMQQVGAYRVARLAHALGVRQSPLEQVPSLALGTSPVTLKEMVAAYGTIANNGSYIEPVFVTRIEDRSGRVLEEFQAASTEQAMSTEAAQTLLDVMRGVIETGTAVGLKGRFGLSGDLAGKTGTTQDNTDGWFIMMHPNLVVGAWMGFNDNRVTMRSDYWGQGAHNAAFIVGDFFRQATKAKLVDTGAKFAAPRDQGVLDPMWGKVNDWWNSVFQSQPAMPPVFPSEPAVVASPAAAPSEPEVRRRLGLPPLPEPGIAAGLPPLPEPRMPEPERKSPSASILDVFGSDRGAEAVRRSDPAPEVLRRADPAPERARRADPMSEPLRRAEPGADVIRRVDPGASASIAGAAQDGAGIVTWPSGSTSAPAPTRGTGSSRSSNAPAWSSTGRQQASPGTGAPAPQEPVRSSRSSEPAGTWSGAATAAGNERSSTATSGEPASGRSSTATSSEPASARGSAATSITAAGGSATADAAPGHSAGSSPRSGSTSSMGAPAADSSASGSSDIPAAGGNAYSSSTE